MNAFGDVDRDAFNTITIDDSGWSSMSSRWIPDIRAIPPPRNQWVAPSYESRANRLNRPTPIKYSNTPQATVQGMQLQPYRPPARNDPLSQIRTGIPTSEDNSMYDHHYIKYGVGAIAVYIVYRMLKK